jgi:hypothetical protein
MSCPAPVDLVERAFGGPVPAEDHPGAAHVSECAFCLGRVRVLRETASAFRWDAWTDVAPPTECLSDGDIAAVAEGIGGEERGRWLAHLAACDACRGRLAGLRRLLRDVAVAAELERLEGASADAPARRLRRPHLAAAAALAAAVVGGVLLRPGAVPAPSALYEESGTPHREAAITTTVAPRILGPVGPASAAESLVWTRVPHADRYRIRVFDREGTLAWDAHTSDTTLAIPAHLRGDTANAYLWKVEARTGWDRWVASEWRDLVILSEALPR